MDRILVHIQLGISQYETIMQCNKECIIVFRDTSFTIWREWEAFQIKYDIEDYLLSLSPLICFNKSDHWVFEGKEAREEGISFFKYQYGFYLNMEYIKAMTIYKFKKKWVELLWYIR